jgi:hypothetical protein
MLARQKTKFHVAQLGSLTRPPVENALGTAELVQDAFEFDLRRERVELPAGQFQLQNGGYDLDTAINEIAEVKQLPRPLILLTALPYGDRETGHEEDDFYFADLAFDDGVALVSTYLWDTHRPSAQLQPYILLMLSTAVFSRLANLEFHEETSGCLFDYCEDPEDVDLALKGPGLCKTCELHLFRKLKSGGVSNFQIAAALRLFDRARGTRRCFLVMPFSEQFGKIHPVVARSISSVGWHVVRADEIARPRRITDAIVQAILCSDLVVADITGNNPNVFYELGFAHAAGCDIIMLCQDSARPLPFDIAQERAVFYQPTDAGLRKLGKELQQLVRIA